MLSRDCPFMTAVRDRDGRCIVSGRRNTSWLGLEAAHIFPLAPLDEVNLVVGLRLILVCPERKLLASTKHKKLDAFAFSINPDVW